MKSLTEIANFYGSDKGTMGPSDTWAAHNYTDVYEPYIESYRDTPINFLEIGLGVTGNRFETYIAHGRNAGGGSIKMWHDYFHNAKIFGIDINECSYLDNDRITTFVVDQGNTEELDTFINSVGEIEFDIIIDDGSHRPDHQQISLSYFFKKLKSGGLYFIEDLLSNGIGDNFQGRMACNDINNTRKTLKHYLQHNSFLEPHSLTDIDYLEKHIDYLRFHVPYTGVKNTLKPSLRNPIDSLVYYKPDSESLCMIRKK